jgi:hypothetical protein
MTDVDQSPEEAKKAEDIDPIKLFSEKIQVAVEGLTYIGKLTDEFNFCGHKFAIQTLLPQHKFAISQVLQPYRDTIHEVDAYQALHVGLAVTAVDGDTEFAPAIGPGIVELTKARLAYVSSHWYPRTIEYIWSRYVLLEATAGKAIAELDRLSQRGQPNTLPPWLDSLIEQAGSIEKTNSDTQPSTPSS